ncbi:hypothetical protein [Nocardioides sp.]|uniref:hypothetical protein n=1 Tax=Nocardioides sp. TaxID=35761 RepID=UPI003518395E
MPRRLPVALSCATVVALATTALSTLAPSPARAEDPTLDPTSYELDVIVNTGYLPPAPSPGAPAGPAADAALPSANGLDVAADGTIYLSSFLLGRIATLTPDGDGGYDLDYVAGAGGFGPASPYPTGTPAATSPLSPAVLTVDPEGGVYFYDNAAGVVYRLETDGTLTHIAGVGGTRTTPGNGRTGRRPRPRCVWWTPWESVRVATSTSSSSHGWWRSPIPARRRRR